MNAVSEAARLALRIGWVTADTASALADVGEGLPWVGGLLTVVRTIRDKVDTAISNKSELKELQERCTYLTACVIVRCRQSSSEINVSPLVDCVTHVQRVVEGCSRRGRFTRVIKSKEDKDEIAELHGRLGKLTRDMGLAGVVVVEGKVDNLNGLLRQLVDKQDEHHAQQMNELVSRHSIGVRASRRGILYFDAQWSFGVLSLKCRDPRCFAAVTWLSD